MSCLHDYTLTVNEGTPTISLSETTFEAEYTGSPITGYGNLAELSGVSGIDLSGDLIYTFYTDPDCATETEVYNGLTGEEAFFGNPFLRLTI